MRQALHSRRWLLADTCTMYAQSLQLHLDDIQPEDQSDLAFTKLDLLQSLLSFRPHMLVIEPWCAHTHYAATDFEFLRTLRMKHPHLHMVVFTAETSPSVLQKIARLDRIGMVSKRDELDVLLDICERVTSGAPRAISHEIKRLTRAAA